MTLQVFSPPTRCPRPHCGGVIVIGETGPACLLCGRSPDPPPAPLRYIRGGKERRRLLREESRP